MPRNDQYRIHETKEDRARERNTLQKFVDGLARVEILDELSTQDAKLFLFGSYSGLIEVKHRNNPASQYPTYTIDSSKIDDILRRSSSEGVYAYLVVSWMGDVRYINLTRYLSGRTPREAFWLSGQLRRDRDEDEDDVYHIPVHAFTKVTLP